MLVAYLLSVYKLNKSNSKKNTTHKPYFLFPFRHIHKRSKKVVVILIVSLLNA